eukprot:sb/3462947/
MFEKGCSEFQKLPYDLRRSTIPEFSEFQHRWRGFMALLDSYGESLGDSKTYHEISIYGNDYRETGIEKLKFLMTVGTEGSLEAVQKTKQKICEVKDFMEDLEKFLEKMKEIIASLSSEILMCSKEKCHEFILLAPYTVKMPSNTLARSISGSMPSINQSYVGSVTSSRMRDQRDLPRGLKLTLREAKQDPLWECGYTFGGSDHVDFFPVSQIARPNEVEKEKAVSLANRLWTELNDLLRKLQEQSKKSNNQLTRLYNALLLGKSSDDGPEWLDKVDRWIKSERPQIAKKNHYDLEILIRMCDEFHDEACEREDLLSRVEEEIMASMKSQYDPDLRKVKNVLENLKKRYNNTKLNLRHIQAAAREYLKYIQHYDDIQKMRDEIRATIVVISGLKPNPKGLPKFVKDVLENLLRSHKAQVEKTLDAFDDKPPKGMGKEISDSKKDMENLLSAINQYDDLCKEAAEVDDYIKRGEGIDDQIEELDDDVTALELQVADIPDDWGNEECEPMLEVAEEELAQIQSQMNNDLTPEIEEFVLDGLALVNKPPPLGDKVREVSETVQNNWETLANRLKNFKLFLDKALETMSDDEKHDSENDRIHVGIKYLSSLIADPVLDGIFIVSCRRHLPGSAYTAAASQY